MLEMKYKTKKQISRNYSLDILRIMSMLWIVGLHILNAGGVISAGSGLNFVMGNLIVAVMYSSVDIFAMLTGYLYSEKEKVSSISIIKLLMVVFFYCIVITAVSYICFPDMFGKDPGLFVISLFPFINGGYWYITSYILMFFMIPYINVFLKTIRKDVFRKMLATLFVLLSVVSTFGMSDYFRINSGYSPLWLIFCYLTGAYIRMYGNFIDLSCSKKLLVLAANVIVAFLIEIIFKKALGFYPSLFEYVSPFVYINAIIILEIFSEIELDKVPRKMVLSLSGASFAVYIIHSHALVFDNLITGRMKWFASFNPVSWLICFILINAGIYLFCYVCELLRGGIFKLLHIDIFSAKLAGRLDKVLGWR